jgi:tRNA-specific 2-thiouridylase
LRDRLGSEVGEIVDEEGAVLGSHKGAYTYTVGQRRGLGLTVPADDGRARYVLRVEPINNRVVVGSREELAITEISGNDVKWCGPVPEKGEYRGLAQVRAHGKPLPCTYRWDGAKLSASLDAPLFGLAPGQALVVYEGERAVGSATIEWTQ